MSNDSESQGGFFATRPDAKTQAGGTAQDASPSSWFNKGSLPGSALTNDISQTVGQVDAKNGTTAEKGTLDKLFDWLSDHNPFGDSAEEKAKKAEAEKKQQDDRAKEEADKKFDTDETAKRANEDKGKAERDKKREQLPEEVRKDLEIEDGQKLAEWEEKKKKDPKKAGPVPDTLTITDKQRDRRGHGKMIGAEYSDPNTLPDKDLNKPIGTLESKADKMKFLETFTQNDKNNPDSASYCGPTAMIAATIHAQGTKGLSPMVAQWQAQAKAKIDPKDPDSAKRAQELDDLQKRIEKGELTNKDMQVMQKNLYDQMIAFQKEQKSDDKTNPAGITDATMHHFLQQKENNYLRKAFIDGGTRMSLIDNDGDDKRNHWVLEMGYRNNGQRAIYDPQTRKNGQVVRAADQVEDYKKTNRIAYDEDGNFQDPFTPEKRDEMEQQNKIK